MDRIREQFAVRRRALILLAGYAVIVGAISFVVYAARAVDGNAVAMIRSLLGLVGVTGGILAWTLRSGRITGWHVLVGWALAQIPVYAWSADGSPTLQIISLPLSITSSTEINGVITSYSEFGVNVVGIVLVALLWQQRMAFTGRRVVVPV